MDIINPYIHGGEALTFDGFGNRSRSFDGVDDNVDSIGTTSSFNFIHISKVFTITLWAKWDEYNTNNAGALVANNYAGNSRGFLLQLDNRTGTQSNGIRFIIYNANQAQLDDLKIDNCVPDSGWHHWALSSDGSTISAYRDGTFIGSYNYQHTATGNAANELGLGFLTNPTTPLNHINGKMADVRIYDTDLTASQVSDLYAGTDVQTNLVGHWLTDADNLLDAAGTNHGTNYGSKYSYDNPSPPVEFGSASRSFDGVNDYVDLGNIFSGDTVFSVSSWIKKETTDASFGKGVISKFDSGSGGGGISWVLFTGETDVRFLIRQTNNTNIICTSTTDASVGEWFHLAATVDGSEIKIYINGNLENTTAFDGTITTSTASVVIGAYNALTNANFFQDGKIADVRYYDTDLTASQVSDIYSGTDVQTNLAGHWLTDNDDVEDKAGTNDGTNFGSTYSYDNPPMDLVPSRQASRDFDGVSDHVNLGNSTEFSFSDGNNDEPFSLSTWLKIDDNSTFRILGKDNGIGSDREWLLATDAGGNLNIYLIDGGVFRGREYTTPLPENEWLHVSATYDGSGGENFRLGLKLYVNGVQVDNADFGSAGYGAMDVNTANNVYIGRYATTYADGKYADVRIYDTDLTASQILDIYNGTTDRTNLIGQWLTNSDDVLDHAGTNDGTNNGSTYSTDSPS